MYVYLSEYHLICFDNHIIIASITNKPMLPVSNA